MKKNGARNVGFIWKKELLDIIRDRRTLVSMIVVPILVIPLIMVGAGALMATAMQDLESREYSVGILNKDAAPEYWDILRKDEGQLSFIDFDHDENAARVIVEEGGVHCAVVLPSAGDPSGVDTVSIIARMNKETSSIAVKRVEAILGDYKESLVVERLEALGASEKLLTPFAVGHENLATDKQMVASQLAMFLPYMLILMTLTGAQYPAVDMTAGEKERGTLETLLASPVRRIDIVFGKFFAIMTTATVSSLISLGSMVFFMSGGLALLGNQFGAELSFSISPIHVVFIILMLLPLSALFASLLMTIGIFAKSTREAQSYIAPLMMLVIFPAMMSLIPGSESAYDKAWYPVVNVSLVMKSILNGVMDPRMIGITILSTAIYAGIAIFITMKVFEKETVIFRV